MNAAFFNAVRSSLYGDSLTQNQVDALNAIGQAWEQYGDGDLRKLAYILATAHHETGAFKWMQEIWGPTAAQKRYEGRKDLGNTQKGDGEKFMGRGFVQLTGRRNYADWAKRTGLDLLKEPQLVEAYPVAARILVQGSMLGSFTGKKLGDYIGKGTTVPSAEYVMARAVVNGKDKAALIAGYADDFQQALSQAKAADATETKPHVPPIKPIPPLGPIPVEPSPVAKPSGVNWPTIIIFVLIALAVGWAVFNLPIIPR